MAAMKPFTFFSILPITLILFVLGWGGLAVVLTTTLPALGPRWLFFFLTVIAITGTVLPVIYFLNRRFPSKPPAGGNAVVRQALWFGIYGSTLAWLQLGRLNTLASAIVLAFIIAAAELLARLWDRSRWKPGDHRD
jgi:hypothetical protein